jgi:hypothetical protein
VLSVVAVIRAPRAALQRAVHFPDRLLAPQRLRSGWHAQSMDAVGARRRVSPAFGVLIGDVARSGPDRLSGGIVRRFPPFRRHEWRRASFIGSPRW